MVGEEIKLGALIPDKEILGLEPGEQLDDSSGSLQIQIEKLILAECSLPDGHGKISTVIGYLSIESPLLLVTSLIDSRSAACVVPTL